MKRRLIIVALLVVFVCSVVVFINNRKLIQENQLLASRYANCFFFDENNKINSNCIKGDYLLSLGVYVYGGRGMELMDLPKMSKKVMRNNMRMRSYIEKYPLRPGFYSQDDYGNFANYYNTMSNVLINLYKDYGIIFLKEETFNHWEECDTVDEFMKYYYSDSY